jgi:hypothetical protein
MENLIRALTIFLKYGNPTYPTHCEQDVMYICGIEPDMVTVEDKEELNALGFIVSEDGDDGFISFKYGSA